MSKLQPGVVVREVTLTDNSKVYDVVICGQVELSCTSQKEAIELCDAINRLSYASAYPASNVGEVIYS